MVKTSKFGTVTGRGEGRILDGPIYCLSSASRSWQLWRSSSRGASSEVGALATTAERENIVPV